MNRNICSDFYQFKLLEDFHTWRNRMKDSIIPDFRKYGIFEYDASFGIHNTSGTVFFISNRGPGSFPEKTMYGFRTPALMGNFLNPEIGYNFFQLYAGNIHTFYIRKNQGTFPQYPFRFSKYFCYSNGSQHRSDGTFGFN